MASKIPELARVTFRDQPAANNAFLGAQFRFEEAIENLRQIRNNMVPCENWAHAEGACHDVNELVELTNRLRYLTESSKRATVKTSNARR